MHDVETTRDEWMELERTGVLEELLGEIVPGVVVLDRDLETGTDLSVDFLAADRCGRLVLVVCERELGHESAPILLEALAWAREAAPVLVRHVARTGGSRIARGDLEPAVAVIAERLAPELVARLAPVLDSPASPLLLLELRTVTSRAGRSRHLISAGRPTPPQPEAEASAPAVRAPGSVGFLVGLDEPRRELAGLLVRRLARMDERVECAADPGAIEWSAGGRPLARLAVNGSGTLECQVPGELARPVQSLEDVDRVVDRALARIVSLERGSAEEPDDPEDAEDLEQIELIPRMAEPLLSEEEIEAFRT